MTFRKFSFAFLIAFFGPSVLGSHPGGPSLPRAITERRYTTAHSLGDGYVFDPRDGWQSANVTNLQYKYGRSLGIEEVANGAALKKKKTSALGDTISMVTGSLKTALQGLKGLGKPEDAVITW